MDHFSSVFLTVFSPLDFGKKIIRKVRYSIAPHFVDTQNIWLEEIEKLENDPK